MGLNLLMRLNSNNKNQSNGIFRYPWHHESHSAHYDARCTISIDTISPIYVYVCVYVLLTTWDLSSGELHAFSFAMLLVILSAADVYAFGF